MDQNCCLGTECRICALSLKSNRRILSIINPSTKIETDKQLKLKVFDIRLVE